MSLNLLMLVTLAVALWQGRFRGSAWAGAQTGWIAGVICSAWLVSLLVGLSPLQPLDANAFSAYWSHYNSLRLARVCSGAWCSMGLYRPKPLGGRVYTALGRHALGVLGVSCGAMGQVLFAGASENGDYRVTAGFSSMHIGGGHIEALSGDRPAFVWGCSFCCAIRCTDVGWASFLLGLRAFFSRSRGVGDCLGRGAHDPIPGTLLARRQTVEASCRICGAIGDGGITLVGMAAGVSTSSGKQRLEQTEPMPDSFSPLADVLSLRDSGAVTALFGQGLGSLPAASPGQQLPDKAEATGMPPRGGGRHLPGPQFRSTLYMAQRVAPHPAETSAGNFVRAPLTRPDWKSPVRKNPVHSSVPMLKVDVKTGGRNAAPHASIQQRRGGCGYLLTRRPVQFRSITRFRYGGRSGQCPPAGRAWPKYSEKWGLFPRRRFLVFQIGQSPCLACQKSLGAPAV